MEKRKAFTLIEVLISIALLGLILVPLFSVVEMMRESNEHILRSLQKSKQITKASKVLFMDILSSDGRIDIKKDEFTKLWIEETSNSLYNLPVARVCWIVLKDQNTLVRVEGNDYQIPLGSEERAEVDSVMTDLELFDVYHEKDKVLVLLKQQGKEPISFMVQGITNPVLEILADGTQVMRDGSKILPDGTIVYKDGSKLLTNGTIVPAPVKAVPRTNGRGRVPPATPGSAQPSQTPPTTNAP